MIHFRSEVRKGGVDARRLKSDARKLLIAVGERDGALSLWLVGDRRSAAINRDYRGKDAPTDVLSFPLHPLRAAKANPMGSPKGSDLQPERLLGDVVISVETARRQAAEYAAPLQNEINRLLIHGLLHLLGHDHERPDERAVMEAEERRLARVIGMPWPYDDHA